MEGNDIMTRKKHHGSSFESFLAEDDLLEEASFVATKKVIAAQIADAMKKRGLTKTAMAAEMATTRAQLDRLLDPNNDSVTLATLKRAAKALGKTLRLELA
jgi:antitoxin HicB